MKKITPIYLDSASTSKVDARVFDEMLPYFTEIYGNASSSHYFGKKSKDAVEKSRSQISELINCESKEIIFTSGATESINLAIKGFLESNHDRGNHIITVKTEHKAVLSTCEYLETKGYDVTYLDVDTNGLISLEQLNNSIKDTTLLVVIMYVNNETGVIQPIKKIGELCNNRNVAFLCDATQAVGKVKVDVEEENIDMLCFSGHKLHGPKGIGVLYKRQDLQITPLIHGGGQENGLRPGTYNTPLIVGLGKACEIQHLEMELNFNKVKSLNEYLLSNMQKTIKIKEVSSKNYRSPYITCLIISNINSNIFIDKHDTIAVSNGSACTSGVIEESHVIQATLKTKVYENNHIRVSLNTDTTKKDIDYFLNLLNSYLKD